MLHNWSRWGAYHVIPTQYETLLTSFERLLNELNHIVANLILLHMQIYLDFCLSIKLNINLYVLILYIYIYIYIYTHIYIYIVCTYTSGTCAQARSQILISNILSTIILPARGRVERMEERTEGRTVN